MSHQPTFAALAALTCIYRPLQKPVVDDIHEIEGAVAGLGDALEAGIASTTDEIGIGTSERFKRWQDDVDAFVARVGPLLPESHPDATAAVRALSDLRMFGTRAMGASTPRSTGEIVDWCAEARSALRHLLIATITARVSQRPLA